MKKLLLLLLLVSSAALASDITKNSIQAPPSSTDNAFTRFDGTNGKKAQNSTATLTDTGVATMSALKLTGAAATQTTFVDSAGFDQTTQIYIPKFNPGAYANILAIELPSTADTTADAFVVLDARAGASRTYPSFMVTSPNEYSWGGLGFDDGTNSKFYLDAAGYVDGVHLLVVPDFGLRMGDTGTTYTYPFTVKGASGDVGIGDTTPDGQLDVTGDSNEITLRITGFAGQTEDLFRVESGAPATKFAINSAGAVGVSGSTGSTGQVLTSAGAAAPPTWTTISSGGASGATGSVQFATGGALASDNANFFWDNAAKRLGIGTIIPSQSLEVNGGSYFGNGTGSQQFDFVTRGDYDALRLYSLNNALGGNIQPPSLGFYRSTTSPAANPRFRISGFPSDLNDVDGYTLGSPNSSIVWESADANNGFSASNGGTYSDVTNVIMHRQRTNFSEGTIVLGTEPYSGTVPSNGTLRSGQKNFNAADIDGSDLTLQAGRGTGNATGGGNLYFQTPDATVSGTAFQAYTSKLTILRNGATTIADTGGNGGNVLTHYERSEAADSGTTTCTDTCAAGKKVIGGGCHSTGGLPVLNTYPSSDTVWTCEFAATTTNCRATAICASY